MSHFSSIIVTGSIAYDEIMDFPGRFIEHFHPEKLHQINVSFVVNKLEKQLGGIATNIAYNIRLVSDAYVTVLSGVGRDGDIFFDFFKKHKIDTSRLLRLDEVYTATGKAITDMGNNQIWGFYFGALEKTASVDLREVLDRCSRPLLIVSPTHKAGFLAVQKQAIEYKAPFVYDPGMALTWISDKDLAAGVTHCRYLIGNDYEIAQVFRRLQMKPELLTAHGKGIITTLGEKGAMYEDAAVRFSIPAYPLKKIVDPTGAGDAFRGGCFGALVEGKSIKESVIAGNALASFAVERYGTINHAPTPQKVASRVKALKG